jgi:atypical dual specificity phosphatase
MKNLKNIAPDYPRIEHIGNSNMTHDDIRFTEKVNFPFTCFVQEKVDGANMGISWNIMSGDAPILRNRNHILRKGFHAKTPAKRQFLSAWNYVHEHKKDIKHITEIYGSELTIYGEWLYAQHSLHYDKLPDIFLAYDIYSAKDYNFLSPTLVEKLLFKTSIKYIKPELITFNSIEEIEKLGEAESAYRTGIREGIVLKTEKGDYVDKIFKFVNSHFERREDFNEQLIKNKINA